MKGATAVRADPVRLAESFRQYRLAVWCDAMERWGMSRADAVKSAWIN